MNEENNSFSMPLAQTVDDNLLSVYDDGPHTGASSQKAAKYPFVLNDAKDLFLTPDGDITE